MQRRRPAGPPRARRAQPLRQEPFEDAPYGDAPDEEPLYEEPYEEPPYEEAAYEEAYGDAPYEDDPYEEIEREPMRPQPEVIATNTAIRLTCTLCAMIGLLAVFMCWAEKESRAIRHFAVQSAAVMGLHVFCALLLFLISGLLGGVPFLGFLLTLVCWLCYIALLGVILVVRARMMLHAWRGVRFTLPGLWRLLEQFN